MTFELDHIFICTDINAPEADRLISFGLTQGKANIHVGQGTANRCFFFHNLMLELLWIHNREEAQSDRVEQTHLWGHWIYRNHGACPFGFCLRSTTPQNTSLPFSSWEYHPPYLPESMNIPVATNADVLTEPILFYLSFAQRPDRYPSNQQQPIKHAAGLREVTRVKLVTPHAESASDELKAMINASAIELHLGEEYLLELGFDRELQGKQQDFRPELPLIFCG
jgi:hypothetical protein